MEADGVTRIYLLQDATMSESLREVFPDPGEPLGYNDQRAVIDRTDLMYTVGGIIWQRPSVTMVEGTVSTDKKELKALKEAVELTFQKTGLTVVVDRLSPEDMRYAGEDHDYGDGLGF